MRTSPILSLILLAPLLASSAFGAPADDPRPIVPASEIMAKIERGEPVKYDGVIVEGDLDISGLDLPTKHVERSESEIKYVGLAEEVNLVTSSVSISDSEIQGDVNFSNAIFQEAVNFRGTNFTELSSFLGSSFTGGGEADFALAEFGGGNADFRETKFSGGAASFGGAKFSGGDVYFESAVFSGRFVNFMSAVFSGGDVYFYDASFNGDATSMGHGSMVATPISMRLSLAITPILGMHYF